MSNNLLKYVVVVALLINAATLGFFWLKHPPQEGGGPQKPPFQIIIDELRLDEGQQKTYEILRGQHRHSTDSLLKRISEKRTRLYDKSPVLLDSIAQQIGAFQQQIELVTFHHFEDVRKICTPEQQKKLDEILLRTVQRVLSTQGERPPLPRGD
jgi:periplasmic protein CpxP/Spy